MAEGDLRLPGVDEEMQDNDFEDALPPLLEQAGGQQQAAARGISVGALQQREPRPDSVKMSNFLNSKAAVWFSLAEASMKLNFVTESKAKLNVVLSALPNKVVAKLGAVGESLELYPDPYLALRTRIMELYRPASERVLTSSCLFRSLVV